MGSLITKEHLYQIYWTGIATLEVKYKLTTSFDIHIIWMVVVVSNDMI